MVLCCCVSEVVLCFVVSSSMYVECKSHRVLLMACRAGRRSLSMDTATLAEIKQQGPIYTIQFMQSNAEENKEPAPPRCPMTGMTRSEAGDGSDETRGSDSTEERKGASTASAETPVLPGRGGKPVYYHSYLQLDKVLDAQQTMSGLAGVGDGKGAHDEHLFIVIHQVYELWFKQILHELNDVVKIFSQPEVRDPQMGTVIHRLRRCTEIQRVLVDQLTVLETMTPLDFLDFRDYLLYFRGFINFL